MKEEDEWGGQRGKRKEISGSSWVAMKSMRSWGCFEAWPSVPLCQTLFQHLVQHLVPKVSAALWERFSISFPKLAQRFGNACPGETPSPIGRTTTSNSLPILTRPATETEFRLKHPFPKRFANFGNERRPSVVPRLRGRFRRERDAPTSLRLFTQLRRHFTKRLRRAALPAQRHAIQNILSKALCVPIQNHTTVSPLRRPTARY